MLQAPRLKRFSPVAPFARGETVNLRWILLLAALHLPLGIFIYNMPVLGLIHQLALFGYGLYCALNKRFPYERVALVVAYIVGAEVLWRMAGVSLVWELGKFVSAAIFALALVRRRIDRIPALPLVYFLALLPACLFTVMTEPRDVARSMLSSIMSGPFFLTVSCVFFANLRVGIIGIRRILTAIILPLFSVGFVTLFYTVTSEDIQFSGESNMATSGGFGPNQVSAMLGCGAFAALLLLIIFQNSTKEKLFLAVAALFMTAQSVMTFSRGGMYNAMFAIAATSLILVIREPSSAIRRFAPILLAGVMFFGLIFPAMDRFTGGTLSERFEDTQGTNRTAIVEADLNIFLENGLLGAGVGSAYELRERYLDKKAMSHTEFARMLAEHGVLGLVAILAMAAFLFTNFGAQQTTFGKAFVVAVAVWAVTFMTNAGMRLAGPSLMLGLTFVTIVSNRVSSRRPGDFRFPGRVSRKRNGYRSAAAASSGEPHAEPDGRQS